MVSEVVTMFWEDPFDDTKKVPTRDTHDHRIGDQATYLDGHCFNSISMRLNLDYFLLHKVNNVTPFQILRRSLRCATRDQSMPWSATVPRWTIDFLQGSPFHPTLLLSAAHGTDNAYPVTKNVFGFEVTAPWHLPTTCCPSQSLVFSRVTTVSPGLISLPSGYTVIVIISLGFEGAVEQPLNAQHLVSERTRSPFTKIPRLLWDQVVPAAIDHDGHWHKVTVP